MTRTVLITGASGGIGRAIAARFAAAGDDVLITGRREVPLRQAAAEIGARAVACDATDPAQVAALARDLGPRLDVLVNNAGGNTDLAAHPGSDQTSGPGQDASADGEREPTAAALEQLAGRWRANLTANLLSAVLTTEAVAGRLAAGGAVISLSSIGAERGGGAYGAAKAALAVWSASLSAEIGPRGVTANVISPGYIAGTDFFHGQMTGRRRAALVAATHDQRSGEPADIAETAFFLASPGARHITGQVIHVNGGAFTTR